MPGRATLEFDDISEVLQGVPQTYLIEHEPSAAELPVYTNRNGGAVGLTRITQSHGGDFCLPPTDIRYPDGPYITDGPADPHHVHPGIMDTGLYQNKHGGITITLDGIEIVQPRYNLIDVQSYLVGNAWHYAAVKAKATEKIRRVLCISQPKYYLISRTGYTPGIIKTWLHFLEIRLLTTLVPGIKLWK